MNARHPPYADVGVGLELLDEIRTLPVAERAPALDRAISWALVGFTWSYDRYIEASWERVLYFLRGAWYAQLLFCGRSA